MKRKAFLLTEQLMTILLQAGLILVLVTAFYLMLNFYTKTQQVLAARNRAERVIQFVDDKVRHVGLGLWQCSDAADIRSHLNTIPMLHGDAQYAYNLPVSIIENDGTMATNLIPEKSSTQVEGNVLTLLYAEKETDEYFIMVYAKSSTDKDFTRESGNKSAFATRTFLKPEDEPDYSTKFMNKTSGVKYFNVSNKGKNNLKRWGVSEALGIPFFVQGIVHPVMTMYFYADEPLPEKIVIPDGSEAMYLRCLQMSVWIDEDNKRHFVWRELTENGNEWMEVGKEDSKGNRYGLQEDDILEIYAKFEPTTNILTLHVLASGGMNTDSDTPRPDAWPKEAEPKGGSDEDAKEKWLESDYKDHVVYVARKSWKLNNLR